MVGDNKLKEDYAITANTSDLESLKARIEELGKSKTEKLPFTKIKTKVWNKRLAPQGSLYYGVSVKTKTHIYKDVMIVNCAGKEDHLEQQLFLNMYLLLCEKRNLNPITNEKKFVNLEEQKSQVEDESKTEL